MEAHVGGLSQPLCRDLIQVLQGSEGPAIEQILRNIGKRALDLTFGLRPPRAASPGLKAIVGGEGQKAGVVNRLVAVISGHYDFHVVVVLWRAALCGGDRRDRCRSGWMVQIVEHNPHSESS